LVTSSKLANGCPEDDISDVAWASLFVVDAKVGLASGVLSAASTVRAAEVCTASAESGELADGRLQDEINNDAIKNITKILFINSPR
jgi:hypothetical protein